MPVIEIDEGVVTTIATDVVSGWIRNLKRLTPLLFTTRPTGQPKPTVEEMLNEGAPMFASDGVNEEIGNRVPIDIHVLSPNGDAKIRTDLP